ncbi:MAG: hypothetical protein GY841_16290 [FCB group bacterium]|nr:hypothetical protein [FCB group bacterium]
MNYENHYNLCKGWIERRENEFKLARTVTFASLAVGVPCSVIALLLGIKLFLAPAALCAVVILYIFIRGGEIRSKWVNEMCEVQGTMDYIYQTRTGEESEWAFREARLVEKKLTELRGEGLPSHDIITQR